MNDDSDKDQLDALTALADLFDDLDGGVIDAFRTSTYDPTGDLYDAIAEYSSIVQLAYVCHSFPKIVNNKLDLAYFALSQPDYFIWKWIRGTPTEEKLIGNMNRISQNDTLTMLKSGLERSIIVLNAIYETSDPSFLLDVEESIDITLSGMYAMNEDISDLREPIVAHIDVLGLPKDEDGIDGLEKLHTTFFEVQMYIKLCKMILEKIQEDPESLMEKGRLA